MDRILVVVFDDEKQAHDGARALGELHRHGRVTLYADAVIVKEANGRIAMRRAPAETLTGTLFGLLTASVVGMLGGSPSPAAGAGTLMGAATDLARAGLGEDFLTEVSQHFLPGRAAVIGEIDEEWQAPVDLAMEALGGRIVRRNRILIEDTYFEKVVGAQRAEVAALEAECGKVDAERRSRVERALAEARRRLQGKEDELEVRIGLVQREGEARIESFRQQLSTATVDRRRSLEKRLAEVRADYRDRVTRLQKAWDRTRAVLGI